jgi:hypothetical protein
LEKGDLRGFKIRQLEGIYGNRYNLKILAPGNPEAAKRLAPGRGFSYII